MSRPFFFNQVASIRLRVPLRVFGSDSQKVQAELHTADIRIKICQPGQQRFAAPLPGATGLLARNRAGATDRTGESLVTKFSASYICDLRRM